MKSKADLEILNKRKHDFEEQYKNYSPIGTKINQQEREINVTEQSYLQVLHALNMAKMKQVNLQLTSSNLTTISEEMCIRDSGNDSLTLREYTGNY